ncbi:MAG: hypothetical protein O7G87_15015 [bacterium]|nr:hypothetical protein [bacterium]
MSVLSEQDKQFFKEEKNNGSGGANVRPLNHWAEQQYGVLSETIPWVVEV